MTMHQLTINQSSCKGTHLCHACDMVLPGLVKYCEQHGRLLISGPATMEHSATISQLAICCPGRAIMVRPMEHEKR